MKPMYVKNKIFLYVALATGIFLALIGIAQISVGLTSKAGKVIITNNAVKSKKNNRTGATGQKNVEQLNVSKDSDNDFFTEYRLERDRTRSQQIDLFREIVNNQNSSEDTRKEAQRRLLAINQTIDTEMKIENLIKAENIKECVALVQEKSATVIVQVPLLTEPDRVKINQIIARITGLSEENIYIIPKA